MNQYHIYEKIGRGKHSVVYKGRKKKTILYYAIKSVEKSQKPRVLQEVRTMHALDQKNILKFYAWYETSNHLWLILEYCVGGDLMSLLKQDTRLPETSVHDFARDLVVALQYLHANSIIHCDLKPSNILLDENGRLKLGGFGMSRRLSDINKAPAQSLPMAKRGTPCYMAPELFSESAPHSSASDLWSLGCVLHECATGQPPFMNGSFNQLVADILNKDPPDIPGATQEFKDLLAGLLDKNPATRLTWKELQHHSFWSQPLPYLTMPNEPALEAYIRKNNLAPAMDDPREGTRVGKAADRARSIRQSVDVMRLSKIASNNLEKESEGLDYSLAQAKQGDIHIENTDAELDFEEAREDAVDDEDDVGHQSQQDESSTMDQGTPTPLGDGARVGINSSIYQDQTKSRSRHSPEQPQGLQTKQGEGTKVSAVTKLPNNFGTCPPLESLVWHASDVMVKPIVGNRRIERLPELRFDSTSLPFPALTLAQMLKSDNKELENFLTLIYQAAADSVPLKDKVNILSYFETLCADTAAANVLINSTITILFVRMMRNCRPPSIRMKLASVLGLLIRHATFVSEDLTQTGIVDILTEALQDKNERVRRRVMATLGELLFYIATQPDGSSENAGPDVMTKAAALWKVNQPTIDAVIGLLKPGEDDVTQHYAVKTVENVCSQGGGWAKKFHQPALVSHLVNIYLSSSNDNLNATVIGALACLVKTAPTMIEGVVDQLGVKKLLEGLVDPTAKVQLSCVNLLNMALSQPTLSNRLAAQLEEEEALVLGGVLALIDNAVPMVRAKAVVTVALLTRCSCQWLLHVCQQKVLPALERLTRDKDSYTNAALAAFRLEVEQQTRGLCQQVLGEVQRLLTPSSAGRAVTSGPHLEVTMAALSQFTVVLHLINSPFLRSSVITPEFIKQLASCLVTTHVTGASKKSDDDVPASIQEFREILMHILEAFCQQAELVLHHALPVSKYLLPALVEVIVVPGETGETRFFCLRMMCDVLGLYLVEPLVYAPTSGRSTTQQMDTSKTEPASQDTSSLATTSVLDDLLRSDIFPLIPQLLSEEDPMPLYALKLLGALLEVNPAYVSMVESLKLTSQFFDFLSLEHSNNNVHNIRLCRQIILWGSLTAEDLIRSQVGEKITDVLVYAHQNNVEPFLEPVLELCHAIVSRESKNKEWKMDDHRAQLLHTFLSQFPVFLDLCAHPDGPVCVAASVCVLTLVSVYPQDTATWMLSSEGAAVVTAALQGEVLGSADREPWNPPTQMQENLLEALAVARSQGKVGVVPSAEVDHLTEVVKQLTIDKGLAVKAMNSNNIGAVVRV